MTSIFSKFGPVPSSHEELETDKHTRILVAAIIKSDPKEISRLIASGADPDRSDRKGNSPMTIAATDPRGQVALRALIEAKVNPNVSSANGRLPLHSVLRLQDDRNVLLAVQALLDAGADPNLVEYLPGEIPTTPLQVALISGRSDKVLELLLRGGADPCLGGDAVTGIRAPLHEFARQGRYVLLEVASGCGVNIDVPDTEGRTCLMLAAAEGQFRTVEVLLDCNANPMLKDARQKDAMMYAREAPMSAAYKDILRAVARALKDSALRMEVQSLRTEMEVIRSLVRQPGIGRSETGMQGGEKGQETV